LGGIGNRGKLVSISAFPVTSSNRCWKTGTRQGRNRVIYTEMHREGTEIHRGKKRNLRVSP
jgi:hypothetical protein